MKILTKESHLNMRDVTHCYVTLPEPEGKYVFVAKKHQTSRFGEVVEVDMAIVNIV